MARIRSVHPGLFTDEAFVELSDGAQILFVGLLTEADDEGVFDWKPTTLRMRLRQNKDGSIEPLLSELEAHNFIRRWEVDGRQVGALRNFRRFQRPKFPKGAHTINDDIRIYVGLSASITEKPPDDEPPLPHGEERRGEEEGEETLEQQQKPVVNGEKTLRARDGKAYAFRARTIRLTEEDFGRWQESFPHLSLRAELESLDDWASQQGKNWFKAVAGALAKRERQVVTSMLTKPPDTPRSDWDGIL